MRGVWRGFWAWYERNYALNIAIALFLFVLQLVHLYWLTTNVVALRLFDESFFTPSDVVEYAILVVDYTEIPALLSVSLIYVNDLRKHGWELQPVVFLLFLNSQWLHIFWITDEFVVNEFAGQAAQSSLPPWLAWLAILIDYLELPVIWDTVRRFVAATRERRIGEALAEFREDSG